MSVHAHNIFCVQEVEVHEWLLSGIRKTILCCSFFTLVPKRFGARIHRLNKKFVRTDDNYTIKDSA